MDESHYGDFMREVQTVFSEFYTEGRFRDKTTDKVYTNGFMTHEGKIRFFVEDAEDPRDSIKWFSLEELGNLRRV